MNNSSLPDMLVWLRDFNRCIIEFPSSRRYFSIEDHISVDTILAPVSCWASASSSSSMLSMHVSNACMYACSMLSMQVSLKFYAFDACICIGFPSRHPGQFQRKFKSRELWQFFREFPGFSILNLKFWNYDFCCNYGFVWL